MIKSKFKINIKNIVISLFLLYFFSINCIYANDYEKNKNLYLTPIGKLVQIDAELNSIVVRSSYPNCPFEIGDYIVKINNKPIQNYSDFSCFINDISVNDVEVVIKRQNKTFTINTDKKTLQSINCNNLLSGFATLTYVNLDNNTFGAIGHPLSIGNTRNVSVKKGLISTTSNLNIQKSFRGNVGCISAQKEDTIGNFINNTNFGIRGNILLKDSFKDLPKYKVADLNEIKLGKAYILLQADNLVQKYEVEIVNINNQKQPEMKTFKIKITDKNLLNLTGGIVQGMSGCPIIQGDKIIGAISHALENDPSYGYGVFIQWMLKGD